MRISIESSNTCNASCTFCPQKTMTRKKGMMSDELFHKVIKDAKELGAVGYYPFLNGEPFLFPKIYEWLDYLEKNDCSVQLYTNADLMDAERVAKYKNIRTVNCSLNAATEETYNKVTCGPNFKRAVENTKKLIEKAPFRVRVSMVVTEDNEHEKGEFKKQWGKNRKFCSSMNWGGYRSSPLDRQGTQHPCYQLINFITVLWDGKVPICCMDYDGKVIVGDANKQTLREIWNAKKEFRDRHNKLDFDMPLCRNCNVNRY